MDSSFEAFIWAIIASAKRRIKELLSDLGFGGDPFVGVREPKRRGPSRGHSSVAVPEPQPESRVDAVAHH